MLRPERADVMKTGLMGGTFNPIHLGHLRIAEEARDVCGLDRIVFIPAADPPHKPLVDEVAFTDRFEMVRLAIQGNPFFEISDMEAKRGGKSYSIDTINAFQAENQGDELFFIIGSDSFSELAQWHCYEQIFASCNLIVVQRPGYVVVNPIMALPSAIRHQFERLDEQAAVVHCSGTTVQFLDSCLLGISSSEIRSRMRSESSIRYLLPPQVEAYIKKQRIYI